MSSKRSTPQSKNPMKGVSSTSKFQTPSYLNATSIERRGSASASRFGHRGHSVLDLSEIGALKNFPTVRQSLMPIFDHDLNCELAYSDYLQAYMKAEVLEKAIEKHEVDFNDQMVIQKDKLYKSKIMCGNMNKELEDLETLDKAEEIVEVMENNIDTFNSSSQEFDLEAMLEQLIDMLNLACNRVALKNVKIIEKQKDYEEFLIILKECDLMFKKLKTTDLHVGKICQLGTLVTRYIKSVENLTEKQKHISEKQKKGIYTLMKTLSDMYAEREKY